MTEVGRWKSSEEWPEKVFFAEKEHGNCFTSVAGCVDEVDLCSLKHDGSVLGKNSDASLSLLVIVIHGFNFLV